MQLIRKEAARKAVRTRRVSLYEKANVDQVQLISQEIIQAEWDMDDDFSKQAIIAKEIDKTSWKSFLRFGDRNCATPGLILYWIDNSAMPLDEQAMWMSENHNMEITPCDLAEFIMDHDRGKLLYPGYQRIEELKRIFKQLTGFNWDYHFAKSHILKPLQNNEPDPF